MTTILEIIGPIVAGIMALLVYIGVFLVLCIPGMLAIYLYKKYFDEKYKRGEVVIAAIRALFMAPIPIIGHGIIIVPLPFGLLAYIYNIGTRLGVQWYILSIVAIFTGSLGMSVVEKQKTKKAICEK